MKKSIFFANVLCMCLLLLGSFSFSGGPYNIAAGKYVFIPVNLTNPVYPFYDDATDSEVSELLYLTADGIWVLLIRCGNADIEVEKELQIGRYQFAADSLVFLDDTKCCTFSGKLKGDRLLVKPEDAKDNFLFVRMNSTR